MKLEPENILYKAKREDNGEWVIGSFLRLDYHNSSDYVESNQIILPNGHSYEVDPNSIRMFFGLHDMNEQMVFTGDRIRILYSEWPSNTNPEIPLDEYKKKISEYGTVIYYEPIFGFCVQLEELDKYGNRPICGLNVGSFGEIEVVSDDKV